MNGEAQGHQDEGAWITEACMRACMEDGEICPSRLFEAISADPRCVAFGPIHHYIDGAVMLSCFRAAQENPGNGERLAADLEELRRRSRYVPGGACARWGVCGAAASVGMAYAIVSQNEPLKKEGWSEGQMLVSRALEEIARAGSPRCCKRDSRIAIREATAFFNEQFGEMLEVPPDVPRCRSMAVNSVCMGTACSFHPDRVQDKAQVRANTRAQE